MKLFIRHGVENFRLAAISIAVTTLLLLAMLTYFGNNALGKFKHVKESWDSYTEESAHYSAMLEEAALNMGYVGFIHHFKNYVLRRDEKYYEPARKKLQGLYRALDGLESIAAGSSEKAAVAELRRTFREYESKMELVREMARQGADSDAIDRIVKIDDTPALQALQLLIEAGVKRGSTHVLETEKSFAEAEQYFSRGFYFQLLLPFIGIILILFLKQLVRSNRSIRAAREQAEKAYHELERTQEAIIQSEKMAALGSLVSGVAHEINTPIGNALAAATHLHAETEKTAATYEAEELTSEALETFFETALQASRLVDNNCQRAAELIQSFKMVAVDQTAGEMRKINLKSYLEDILRSFAYQFKRTNIDIDIDCPATLELFCDPGVLTQVINNLLANSLLHGFDEDSHGNITIAVATMSGRVELRYDDDGKGIPDAIADRIFDPFFTTRRGSGGSGLGLNIVYNLVENKMGGTITYQKKEGKGVRFLLAFPVARTRLEVN